MEGILRGDALKITVYTAVTLLLGAVLTPLFYRIGVAIHDSGALAGHRVLGLDLHEELGRADLARYFNRAMMLAALAGLGPVIRWLGGHPRDFLRLEANGRRGWHLAGGFFLAAGGFFLLGWGLMAGGVFVPNPKARPLVEAVAGALFSGLAVGLLEEFFFRGCLLGLALRTAGRNAAMLFVAVFFAAVHFLKPPEELAMPDPVTWTSGFWLLGRIFHQFTRPEFMVAEFTTLFLVGWILGYTRLRTRSLWMAIGLHGGWVFGIKLFGAMTRRARGLEETLPWIGKDLKSGLAAVAVVAITGVAVWAWLTFGERDASSGKS
jgi:membrane protease YdiL (CAAX protease family)